MRIALVVAALLLAAASAAVPPPTAVDFRVAPASPAVAAAEFTKQTGVPFEVGDAEQWLRPLPAVRSPFWQTADAVAAGAGRPLVFNTDAGRLALGPARPADAPAPVLAHSGPFRIAARRVSSRVDLDSGRAGTDVDLEIWWEPRLRVYLVDNQPKATAVTDDKGRPLSAMAPAGGRVATTGSGTSAAVRLSRVSRDAGRITRLEGTFTAVAAERFLTFAFGDLEAARSARVAMMREGVTASLRLPAKRRADAIVEADVEVKYSRELPEFESFQSWVPANRCTLRKEGEKALTPYGYDVDRQSETAAAVTYRFRVPGSDMLDGLKGWRLEYETPAAIEEFAVPFVLRDLPLP